MKLKRLDIHGFKSFYHRTTVVFDDGITGIVGPNGCGKSNIVDALKWVMGEQGAKSLRGTSMEDVIFSGSGQRGPMGMCEVNLTFQNTGTADVPQRWADVSDIAIQRRLERSKGSDYSVNKQRCRLADIQDLLSGTGIASGPGGRRAYAIIEQGQIDRIVSAKADERRLLIEEAAGISRYRQRRHLAERKMLGTEQNLERVDDIVAEVERQMRSLRRQAKKAERFREYRDEARQIALEVAVFDYAELKEALAQQAALVNALMEAEKDGMVAIQAAETARTASQSQEQAVGVRVQGVSERLRRVEESVLVARERITGFAREKDMLHGQLDQAQRDLAAGEGRRSELESELDETRIKCEHYENESARFQTDYENREIERQSAVRSLLDARADQERLVRLEAEEIQALARARADLEMSVRMQRELAVRRERLLQQNQSQLERAQAHADAIEACNERLGSAQSKAEAADKRVTACARVLEAARDQLEAAILQERQLREQIVTDRSRRDSLVEVEKRRADLSDGSKHLLDAGLTDCLGAISTLVDVPVKYEAATLAALGVHLDAVVMANAEAVSSALALVSQDGMDRVLVANASVQGTPSRNEFPGGAKTLGFLVDSIAPSEHQALLTYLLSDAVLVESFADGEELVAAGWRGTVVTLNGERFEGEAITFAGITGDGAGPIGRRREIKTLTAGLAALETEHGSLASSLELLRNKQIEARRSLDAARVEARQAAIHCAEQQKEFEQLDRQRVLLAQATNRFQQDLGEIETELVTNQTLEKDAKVRLREAEAHRGDRQKVIRQAENKVSEAESVRDTAVSAMHDAKSRAMTAGERLLSMKTLLSRLERQIKEIQVRRDRVVSVGDDVEKRLAELESLVSQDRQQCGEAETEATRLGDELATVRAEYATVRDRMGEVDTLLEQTRRKRDDLRQKLSDGKLEHESIRLRLETLELRMKDRYHIEVADALSAVETAERPGPEQIVRLEELEALLEKMGEVNISAIEEFEAVEERHQFLTAQREDLLNALSDLETAITEIDKTTKQLFAETFEAVRGHFRELFPRLFRGGEADLVLTDPDNLLATGINMDVCPPGKKIQSVELLSGGEKAMCAIALVFAVFRHRPSPFCLLDEVDAPLDDANIGRFNEVVREIAQQSQVVLVTHNKRTMEIADSLYGVTMEESGVSKLVGVRMS